MHVICLVLGDTKIKKEPLSGETYMKINPTDRSPQLSIPAVDPLNKKKSPGNFNSVFQESIAKSERSKSRMGLSVQPLLGSMKPTEIRPDPESRQCELATGLLDKLEHYQKMLADPAYSLRMIQPAVDHMERQAVDCEALLDSMPEGHPLKMILQESILNINQEIERFNTGYYLDG